MGFARTLSTAILSLAAAGVLVGTASAETPWQAHHPRQEQVLNRDAHERARIVSERREGDLSRVQAHRLLAADHRIAVQDHRMARANGGFLTKAEQHKLNREEAKVSHRIPG